ncbi:hypothetical protein A2X44_02150 [candidate division CPR3 bacterium GWF2_35_18]|uniref:Cof-like protein hydrolase n=1 Tax=candidate division CPR3 bacterium GW2011_GWF2_35_18 TaxID=1618350 RepID=A0A0G0BKM1_UNCC3|nr:MAG: Cof-like protein hydrolase [candidate division CPR3 bacterium GW2011_GWF2_35_18]KKP85945.1 MAG: Cof-like protein hydrolase [candidate division CPR3 bacterium GW2011_GWE2_35_7]OGB62800.1 MAG: hypothetical protein A2X44_02150 [candidate division CPR3 bacterium GWF2_35_18]OGB65381.1 MAG: hypothetical protein A2250_00365 [candidate division CPR3 bacterium RIFOXYA2_FULL_35_13]OGB75591.1 MAG: hypothetical protein A2476_03235 [candidate division CPR3 bacterium RIFOXYC2_FULL_35_7]OGB78261.1 MA
MNKKNIRLCVFDIDGTLKQKHVKIDIQTKKIIKKIQDKGIYCTVATGRGFLTTHHELNDLKLNAPLIISDGSCICDSKRKNLFFSSLENIEIERIENYIYRYHNEIKFIGFWDPNHTQLYAFIKPNRKDEFLESIPNIKIKIYRNIENLFELAYRKHPSQIAIITFNNPKPPIKSNAVHDNGNINFVNPGVSKKQAAFILGTHLNISKNEIMVFAHDDDDLPIFDKNFGLNVALRTATSQVKQKADIVLENLDNIFKEIL